MKELELTPEADISNRYKTNNGRVRVGLVWAGGTIASGQTASGIGPKYSAGDFKDAFYPKKRGGKQDLRSIYNVDEHTPDGFEPEGYDSTEFSSEHLASIIRTIDELITREKKRYAGIVVTCGTDSMAIAAQAAAFALQNVPIPVVFTGSQLHPEHDLSDALSNFKQAVMIAARSQIAEVLLSFDRDVHRAAEVRKNDANDIDAFRSPHVSRPLVDADGPHMFIRGEHRVRMNDTATSGYEFRPEFSDAPTLSLAWDAGQDMPTFSQVLGQVRGMVLHGLAGGNIPARVGDALAANAKLPADQRCFTVIVPQCDTRIPAEYQVLASTNHPGYVFAEGMLPTTARIKMQWLFGQAKRLKLTGDAYWKFLRQGFQQINFVGERPIPLTAPQQISSFLHPKA